MPCYKDYLINSDIFKNSIKSIMILYAYENINSFIHQDPINIIKSQKYYYLIL